MRVKMSKPPQPAPTASAIGPCPTVIKIVGRPGTGSLPSTIAPPDHPPPPPIYRMVQRLRQFENAFYKNVNRRKSEKFIDFWFACKILR